jgi:hypothetical protein
MAKLTSILQFNGSLQGLSAYKMKGVEGTVLRVAYGPSKEDIETKRQYDITRRNLSEMGGRSTAASWLMKAFQPLRSIADPHTLGQLNRLLRAVQLADTTSEYGKRSVALSLHPALLQGCSLTKAAPFDSVVRASFGCTLSRESLSASLELPSLKPRLNFFPPQGYTFCRVVAALGVAPDLFHAVPKYRPQGDYNHCHAVSVHSDWFAAGHGAPAQTLALSLPYTPPNEAFSLVLSVGVQVGMPGISGAIEPLRGRVGSAKILAVV